MNQKQNFLETIRWGSPEYVSVGFGPLAMIREPGSKSFDPDGRDCWGVKWKRSDEVSSRPCVMPGFDVITDLEHWQEQLVVPDLKSDRYDFEKAAAEAATIDRDSHLVCLNCTGGIFERTHFLLGFQECLMDMMTDPELVAEIMQTIAQFKIDLLTETWNHTHFDAIFFHDDWGSKTSLFFSPALWKELIAPLHQQVVNTVKELGNGEVIFIHHSDTFLEPLLPEMAKMGIDVWQGCIPQNDIIRLQQENRGKIGFMGGIDIAKIDREDASEEEIRQEVRRAIDTYVPYGGFVPGIPSGGALFPRVQRIVTDELTQYAEIFSKSHFIKQEG